METVCVGAHSAVKLQGTEINRNMFTECYDKGSDLISLHVRRQNGVRDKDVKTIFRTLKLS